VIDEVKRPIGRARETVKLNLDAAQQARQKTIQYTTSFNLPPGKYHLKIRGSRKSDWPHGFVRGRYHAS